MTAQYFEGQHDQIVMIKVIGYCSKTKGEILESFLQGRIEDLRHIRGEFVIIIEDVDVTEIISSYYGVCQYFYAEVNSELYHGDTVYDVLRKSGLQWHYDFAALADLICFDHLLEDCTLHPEIKRIPPATHLSHDKNGLRINSLSWNQIHGHQRTTPRQALDVFNHICEQLANSNAILSMSGGFDSRVILSSLLHLDIKPRLLVMGFPNTTDVIISETIAETFGLEIDVVALKLEDYFDNGLRIAELTSGTKTARHWHSYIYPRRSVFPTGSDLFIGSNGEFARSYYTGYGTVSRIAHLFPDLPAADRLLSMVTIPYVWAKKLKGHQLFTKTEFPYLCDQLQNELGPKGIKNRIRQLYELCHGSYLKGFDRFYLEQKVPNFISSGLKLCQGRFNWRVPFLTQEWIESIANMSPKHKVDSRWHRFAISENEPRLLSFPFEHNVSKVIPYAPYSEWFAGEDIDVFVRSNAELIGDILHPMLVNAILDEQIEHRTRTDTVSFLLCQIFWRMAINRLDRPDQRDVDEYGEYRI